MSSPSVKAEAYQGRVYANHGLPELVALFRHEDRMVLDIGCGAGDNARWLVAAGRRVHGVTLSEEEAALAGPLMERVTLADVETWVWDYPDGNFDAVLLSHVLEHLVAPDRLLVKLGRLLRPGGRVYVALPNALHWRQRVEFVRGRFEYAETGPMDRTHLRFFTFASAQRLLQQAGFRVVQATVLGHVPLPIVRKLVPGIVRRLDRLAVSIMPGLLGVHIMVVGEKPHEDKGP